MRGMIYDLESGFEVFWSDMGVAVFALISYSSIVRIDTSCSLCITVTRTFVASRPAD
jgi:hypothetical protein